MITKNYAKKILCDDISYIKKYMKIYHILKKRNKKK